MLSGISLRLRISLRFREEGPTCQGRLLRFIQPPPGTRQPVVDHSHDIRPCKLQVLCPPEWAILGLFGLLSCPIMYINRPYYGLIQTDLRQKHNGKCVVRHGVIRRLCGMETTNHIYSHARVPHCFAQQSINFQDPKSIYYKTEPDTRQVEWTTDEHGHVIWLEDLR